MNLDRYRHPVPEIDDRQAAPEVPVKPHLAERLLLSRSPARRFCQQAMNIFADIDHTPLGQESPREQMESPNQMPSYLREKMFGKPAPVEENPWREFKCPSDNPPCDSDALIHVRFLNGKVSGTYRASSLCWHYAGELGTIAAWRFAETQQ